MINGYQGRDEILMITLIFSKKLGVYKIMRSTVLYFRFLGVLKSEIECGCQKYRDEIENKTPKNLK